MNWFESPDLLMPLKYSPSDPESLFFNPEVFDEPWKNQKLTMQLFS